MANLPKHNLLSIEDYLEGEKQSTVRYEYVAGHVYAMVGASGAHNRIALNIATAINSHLRGTPCRVFMSDMKVNIATSEIFYYPDIVVSCQPADIEPDNHILTDPILIIEVLSPSTERIDREEKLKNYQSLTNLREYVLVPQKSTDIQIYRWTAAGWNQHDNDNEEEINLESIDLKLTTESIYAI